jgi:hypothetical protein
MSYWRIRHRNQVTCYLTDGSGVVKQVPRKLTKHLDGQPASVIQAWLEDHHRSNAAFGHRPDLLAPTPELTRILDRYFAHLVKIGRVEATIKSARRHLLTAVQFFDNAPLSEWPKASKQFFDYVRVNKPDLTENEVRRHCQCLKRFWDWCLDMDLADVALPMRKHALSAPQGVKDTPLPRVVLPEEVLGWESLPPDLRLISLLCYFCSLRPQEAFAGQAWRGGKAAEGLEACQVMREAGLYDRLAVNVQWQKREKGALIPPKLHSKGVVACFDERAARAISALLNAGVKTPNNPNAYYNAWARCEKGVTLKDLRRASCYWLGHYTSLSLPALQNHMRHASILTTQLYTRRPDDVFTEEEERLILLD